MQIGTDFVRDAEGSTLFSGRHPWKEITYVEIDAV